MNHALLKSVIYDQHEFIRNFQIVPRDYEFEENGNYVLVGLRRAGKSTLLYKIVLDLVASGVDWEQIIYINFEDERLSEFTVADFNDLLSVQSEMSDKKGYFFLDEVQNIDGWEKFARRMADAKEHIYITGSNAKMLSREIETTLGGRFFAKHITPYAFGEYLTGTAGHQNKREDPRRLRAVSAIRRPAGIAAVQGQAGVYFRRLPKSAAGRYHHAEQHPQRLCGKNLDKKNSGVRPQ